LEAAGSRRIHDERASGGRWDRPELTHLLARLTTGDVLVVWKLDRLSRSLKDLLLILERITAAGAGFRSLTESIDTTVPAGLMMMQMLGAFAEYEREMMKERIQAGLKAARAQGRHGGRRPKFTQAQRAEVLSMLTAGRPAAEVARFPIVPGAPRDDQPTQCCVTSGPGCLNWLVHATFGNLAENRPTVCLGHIAPANAADGAAEAELWRKSAAACRATKPARIFSPESEY